MPLFQAPGPEGRRRTVGQTGRCDDEKDSVLPLTQLCLLSLADNMKEVWVKDYAENYLDQYSFRYIMGPFNLLPGELVKDLMSLLCSRKQMSRAALHLLLVPQLRSLSLGSCPGLVSSDLCAHITARCQRLWTLDLSGAQYLPSKVLSETLGCLPALRSLSLAGTLCDRRVITMIAHRCRLLRHLDVSCCSCLSPAVLLPLVVGASCPSSGCPSATSSSCVSSSCSAPLSPLPLSSLLALDIGFGEEQGDSVAAAAYLLLSLPCLQRVALDGLTQACCLIQHRQFSQTDEFTDREGVPRLEEVWRQWRHMDSVRKTREATGEEEEEERILRDSEENASRAEGPSCSQNQEEVKRVSSGELILRLKDVEGASCEYLDSLSRACPNICSISVNTDCENTQGRSQGSLLAASLQRWSNQLQRLSLHHPGPLVDLLPALQVAGSSLVSLILDGVKTSAHTPLLEVIRACPRLRDLLISAEPPTTPQDEEDGEDQRQNQDLPQLPSLCSLTLNFFYEHSRMKPVMSWMLLKRVLRCLLTGSPLLQKLSLVSLPCPLNCVLEDVLDLNLLADSPSMPLLGRVQQIVLSRTDVRVTTVNRIMRQSKRLTYVDVSYCWEISRGFLDHSSSSRIQVVWS